MLLLEVAYRGLQQSIWSKFPPPPKKIKKHSECSKSLDVIGRLSVKQFDQQLRTVKLSQ